MFIIALGVSVFIRFQGKRENLGTASKLGIFQLAYDLRDSELLPKYVLDELNQSLAWLKMHLHSPTVLRKEEHFRAISWFRDTAKEPLKRIWRIKTILEEYGYPIDVVKTKVPGSIVFQDGWQVIAKPAKRNSRQ